MIAPQPSAFCPIRPTVPPDAWHHPTKPSGDQSIQESTENAESFVPSFRANVDESAST